MCRPGGRGGGLLGSGRGGRDGHSATVGATAPPAPAFAFGSSMGGRSQCMSQPEAGLFRAGHMGGGPGGNQSVRFGALPSAAMVRTVVITSSSS